MIHLAAVVDTFDIGGFELACLDLLRRLDRSRFQPVVYSFRPGALVARAEADGIPVVVGHDKRPEDREWTDADSRARLDWGNRLAELMVADKIDVCLTWAWPEAIAAARSAGVGAVVERVDGPSLVDRVPDKAGTVTIVESRAVRDILIVQRERFGIDPRRLVMIRNGIDLERFDPSRVDARAARDALGIPSDAFVVGTIARLAPEKNLGQIVTAFAQAAADDEQFRSEGWLVVAGPDGGSEQELRSLAQELGVAERVIFPGTIDDQPSLLAALDVFCITSYTEGSPAAVLEAMAMARPVVATPVGALPELLDGNAILVDVMAPRATVAALLELFRDRELRDRLGARGRAIARRWPVGRQVRRYERVLEDAWRESQSA